MGDLRDQLKKAKLLSKKDAKRLAHEERVHKKQVGREGLEKERDEREDELRTLQQDDREKTRELQAELDAERSVAEERAACAEILRHEARAPRRGGQGRFYFALADGRIPSLPLTEGDRSELLGGQLHIARVGPPESHVYGLLAAHHAERVRAQLPAAIVWPVGASSP